METGNCISEEEVFEIASFKSMNEITGRVIKVKLWNEKNEFGLQVVTIAFDDEIIVLDREDIAGLISPFEHIVNM